MLTSVFCALIKHALLMQTMTTHGKENILALFFLTHMYNNLPQLICLLNDAARGFGGADFLEDL